jgi:F0F1-type ATP synthase delta subunit
MKQEEEIIKKAVESCIVELSLDSNGTHVMQKIISVVKEDNREEINNAILQNFVKLVFDANGICVVNINLTFSLRNLSTIIRTRT